MDHEHEIVELLREQNQLLKKYFWRLRFSLLGLLLLTTITCVGLGILVYQYRAGQAPVTAAQPKTAVQANAGKQLSWLVYDQNGNATYTHQNPAER